MVNNISSSQLPFSNYPSNAVGATKATRDMASYCYDTQRPSIAKTYNYLTTDKKQDLAWPIAGIVTSLASLALIGFVKRGKI